MLRAKGLYAFLNEMTARVTVTDFNLLPIPFAAIATDLETGESVVLGRGTSLPHSGPLSIPGIFEPWERNGRLLVDGGLKANLPVLEAKKLFPGHPIVAVNLSPENITKKGNHALYGRSYGPDNRDTDDKSGKNQRGRG